MNKNIGAFVGASSFSKEIEVLIPTLSKNNASVLLIGERGTGKRFIAQHIHYSAEKNLGYFYEINCKSYNETQIEISFDTVERMISFEQRITLFICFVDEMSLELQKKFLLLINKSMKNGMNLKVICSTESSLEEKVSAGTFLSELYFRLNAVVLNILPLRQRKEDIIPIARNYLNTFSKKSGYKFTDFSESTLQVMMNHFWIGNIDELINSVQKAFIVGEPPLIKTVDMGLEGFNNSGNFNSSVVETELEDKSLKNAVDLFKKEYVTKILEETGWNQTKAAKILGIQRTYVIRLMNELQIRK